MLAQLALSWPFYIYKLYCVVLVLVRFIDGILQTTCSMTRVASSMASFQMEL